MCDETGHMFRLLLLTLCMCVFVQLSNSVDRYINNFQIVDNLSDRGSLIIHLFKVKHCREQVKHICLGPEGV